MNMELKQTSTEKAIIAHLEPLKLVQTSRAFFESWKELVRVIQPELFLSNGLTMADTICTKDLTPNIEIINHMIGSLSIKKQKLTCLLVSFYDPEEGKNLSKKLGFDLFSDITQFDNAERYHIGELFKNYTNPSEYWGDIH